MESIKNFILSQLAEKKLSKDEAKKMLNEILESKKEHAFSGEDEEIAIIGMACRLPEANSPEEFWNNLKEARNSIRSFPDSRKKDVEKAAAIIADEPEYSYGGYLENIKCFDNNFFRISPKEAEYMEPEQRLFLETAWSALEDAGIAGNNIKGSRTGVFIGRDTSPKDNYKDLLDMGNELSYTGNINSIAAGRLSYIMDLKGEAMIIDSACSSSLSATHLACNALRRKEIDVAVVGGICMAYIPLKGTKGGLITSEKYRLSPFDNSADGTIWGEGVCAIVLKRMNREEMDKHDIYAIIKGDAINNDGTSNGMTAPSAQSQADVIKEAWQRARVEPQSISYIETHGTGTKIGDPIEIKGISEAFREYTDQKQFCGIGAVKSNIGHNVGASGTAALMKAALSLKNRKLLPTINFDRPNTHIDFSNTPIYVNDRLRDWDTYGYPRRCGVNSFGLSGTNCHIVLEEAPEKKPHLLAGEQYIFTFSAKTGEALKRMLGKYITFMDKNPDIDLASMGNTMANGRQHFNYRVAIISSDLEQLRSSLEKIHGIGLDKTKLYQENIFYGMHYIVLMKNEDEENVLTEADRDELTKKAGEAMKGLGRSDTDLVQIYREICSLYVQGADILWDKIYRRGKYPVISLPTYEFESISIWGKSEELGGRALLYSYKKDIVDTKSQIRHPLLDELMVQTMEGAIFATAFNPRDFWVVSEHKISEEYVIPGTAYLEMAVAAGEEYTGGKVSSVFDVQYYSPIICRDNTRTNVQTVLRHADDHIEFQILSCRDEFNINKKYTWTKHCEGKIGIKELNLPENQDINALNQKLGSEETEFIIAEKAGQITFGSRWNGPCRGKIKGEQILAFIQLQDNVKDDVKSFTIHPALMDISTSMGAFYMDYTDFYLPFRYKAIHIYRSMPDKIYAYITRVNKDDREIIRFNIDIFNEVGEQILRINEFSLKRVSNIKKTMLQLSGALRSYYGIDWIEHRDKIKEPEIQTGTEDDFNILIVYTDSDKSRNSVNEIRARVSSVISAVISDEDETIDSNNYRIKPAVDSVNSLIEKLEEKNISSVLFISMGLNDDDLSDIEQLQKVVRSNLFMLFHLSNSIGRYWGKKKIRLMALTNHAGGITGNETMINPTGSAVFGIAKIIGEENPNISCVCVDTDNNNYGNQIIGILRMDSPGNLIAFRDGRRYYPVLAKRENNLYTELNDISLKKDGCYIVTGGAGGMALCLCKNLAYMYEGCHIVLTGRSKLPAKDEWREYIENGENSSIKEKLKNFMEIGSHGVDVTYVNVDVADYNAMKETIEALTERFGKINGIIHTAGIAGDGFIKNKDIEVFEGVVSPKIYGTWILDKLTQNMDLEFFVMFSSIASIIPSAGQSDYTSANSYMDSFAQMRHMKGKQTVSINWPAWKDTGMAFNFGANQGGIFIPLSNEEGVYRFNEILHSQWVNSIPAEINYSLVSLDMDLPIEITNEIRQEILKRQKLSGKLSNSAYKETDYSDMVLTADNKDSFTETEKTLARFWYEILGIREIDINEKFYNLGGDSLQSIQLYRKLEDAFPGKFDISDIYTYSSIFKMAEYIDSEKSDGKEPENSSTASRKIEEELDDVLKKLADGEINIDDVEEMVKMEDE